MCASAHRARLRLPDGGAEFLSFEPADGSRALQTPLTTVKAVLVGGDSVVAKRMLTAASPVAALARLSAGKDLEDEPLVSSEGSQSYASDSQMNRCMTIVTVAAAPAAAGPAGLLSPTGGLGSPAPAGVAGAPSAKLLHVVFDTELECKVWATGLSAVLQAAAQEAAATEELVRCSDDAEDSVDDDGSVDDEDEEEDN